MTIKIDLNSIMSGWQWAVRFGCNGLGGNEDRIVGGWAISKDAARDKAYAVIEGRTST